jgi:hypothetical protein
LDTGEAGFQSFGTFLSEIASSALNDPDQYVYLTPTPLELLFIFSISGGF